MNMTRSLGAPPGPGFELAALRACLTSSFGRSGRVTHATMHLIDSEKFNNKSPRKKNKTKLLRNPKNVVQKSKNNSPRNTKQHRKKCETALFKV